MMIFGRMGQEDRMGVMVVRQEGNGREPDGSG